MNVKLDMINLIGSTINKRVIIFESDDWGMVRMASKKSQEKLKSKGYPVDSCTYNKNDALESNTDIQSLVEVLFKHKDRHGNPAKFTLNNVVANPDFEKIRESNFEKCYFEPFTETLQKYNHSDNVLKLYREGMDSGIFQIQSHGREHVNVNRWLAALQQGDKRFTDAFEEKMFTVAGQGRTSGRKDFLDSFGRAYNKEFESESSIIKSGLELFESVWGFKSKSFIAPCYVWSPEIESHLVSGGVKYIQGTHVQRIPVDGLELKIKKKYHWQGKKNASGLKSIVRNVMFEPAEHNSHPATVDRAMAQIKNAFFWRKPAVISSHRVNYISRLNPENKDKNLKLLDELLTQIIKNYPDVQFVSSDELGEMFEK